MALPLSSVATSSTVMTVCSGMTVSTRSADITGDGWTTLQCGAGNRLQPDPEKPSKRVTSDTTVLYTAAGGRLTKTVVGRGSAFSSSVQGTLCATKPDSLLCRKPR